MWLDQTPPRHRPAGFDRISENARKFPMTSRNDKGQFAGSRFSVTLITFLCMGRKFLAGSVTPDRLRPNKGWKRDASGV